MTTTTTRKARTAQWRAMGSTAEVVVNAPRELADAYVDLARRRIAVLESTWSRFIATSELSALNARAGQGAVPVTSDMLTLVAAMREGWDLTGGLFDPTVLTTVIEHGYDRDFAGVIAQDFLRPITAARPAAGMSDVEIDMAASTITLPAGLGIDPGAIGKGLAADLMVEELIEAGAHGALVSIGGDLAFAGDSGFGSDGGWTIGIEDERFAVDSPQRMTSTWTFADDRGGVATSTTLKRRWANGTRHHSIDPRTGRMSSSDVLQATVAADSAWIAEVCATAALVLDNVTADAWLASRGLTSLLLTDTHPHTDTHSDNDGGHHG